MSLQEVQFRKTVREVATKILKDGHVPSLGKITKETSDRLQGDQTTPTLALRVQRRRTPWDLSGMNSSLKETGFDLEVLYLALIESSARVLSMLSTTEASNRAQGLRMDRTESTIKNLLFALQNGDGYFDGFFDDLRDLNHVDLVRSTPGMVDLTSQDAELPPNLPSTGRILLAHLADQSSWPVEVQAESRVLSSQTPVDAPFKNMFLDTVTMWRHDVVTQEQGPIAISFTIPMTAVDGTVDLTRIQLEAASEFPQNAEVLYSSDGVNFVRFSGAGQVVSLDRSSRVVNLDFSRTRVKLLKITLYRDTCDKSVDNGFLTSFGLKLLACYTMGRAHQAELISKPFLIKDGTIVEQVALSVFEEIPGGTDIQYFVGLARRQTQDSHGLDYAGEWAPITPIGRPKRADEAPRVLKTSSLFHKKVGFVPLVPLDPVETVKGVDYYALNQDSDIYTDRLIIEDVVFGTALLYRGINAWFRQSGDPTNPFTVADAYLPFQLGPRQKLYGVVRETVDKGEVLELDGSSRTTFKTSRAIDWRVSEGMSLIPPAGVDAYAVPDPLHAIYEVKIVAPSDQENETLVLPTTGSVAFTKGPIDVRGHDLVSDYLSAWRTNEQNFDEDLVDELESRTSLIKYHGKTILNMISNFTAEELAAGKPAISTITIGDGSISSNVNGVVLESTPVPKATKRTLTTLSDDQLLDLFGQVKFRTTVIGGITAVKSSTPSVVYLPDVDFSLEARNNPTTGLPELRVSRTPNSAIGAGESVVFSFQYLEDITSHVIKVENDLVYLDTEYSFLPTGTKFKVGYRFLPVGANKVRKDTLKVCLSPNGKDPATEGVDYQFNVDDATIVALSGGRLVASQAAFASFACDGLDQGLETFSTWVRVRGPNPVRIRWTSLEVDRESGERVMVSVGAGRFVEISGVTESPELAAGWHQFLVTSKRPDIHPASAIQKTVELLDLGDEPIFLGGGLYFSEIRGTRQPMTQATVDFLEHGVIPGDHTKFALNDAGQILVNFQPNSQAEFYTYGWRQKDVTGTPTDVLEFYDEEFELLYDARDVDARNVGAIVFRALLSRQSDNDASLTPKLSGYQIRMA